MSPLLLHGNTNQYNINGLLCTYTELFRIQTCCNYSLSAAEGFRGAGGRRQRARFQGFCQFYLVLSLFYSLQRRSNGFIAEKTILILYEGSRVGPLFSRGGGGVKLLPGRGVQMLISLETHVRTCYFPGGGGPDPLSPSGSAHGQCHHNGTVFITVPLLTIIVRH